MLSQKTAVRIVAPSTVLNTSFLLPRGARRFASDWNLVKKNTKNDTFPRHRENQGRPSSGYRNPSSKSKKGTSEDFNKFAADTDSHKFVLNTYKPQIPVISRGSGSWVWDTENKKYLDFTSGITVTSLGHTNLSINDSIKHQTGFLQHTSNVFGNVFGPNLCRILVNKTIQSGGMHDATAAFLCNSGTEANEAAIKFSRKAGKLTDPTGAKHEIVSFSGGFHGRTLGALSASPHPQKQDSFAPLVPGFRVGTFNQIEGLNELINENTAGVIVEPIQGESGIHVATDEFLTAVATRCHEVGAMLTYDEVQCGLGRTGQLWAHSHLPKEAHPDMITSAKALGNGLPIGAVIVNPRIRDSIAPGDHGSTFGGNVLISRVASKVVSIISLPSMLLRVRRQAWYLRYHLDALQAEFPDVVTEIRGKGMILGLQLSEDPTRIVDTAREAGLLVLTAGENTIRLLPCFLTSDAMSAYGIKILRDAIVATRPGTDPAALSTPTDFMSNFLPDYIENQKPKLLEEIPVDLKYPPRPPRTEKSKQNKYGEEEQGAEEAIEDGEAETEISEPETVESEKAEGEEAGKKDGSA